MKTLMTILGFTWLPLSVYVIGWFWSGDKLWFYGKKKATGGIVARKSDPWIEKKLKADLVVSFYRRYDPTTGFGTNYNIVAKAGTTVWYRVYKDRSGERAFEYAKDAKGLPFTEEDVQEVLD